MPTVRLNVDQGDVVGMLQRAPAHIRQGVAEGMRALGVHLVREVIAKTPHKSGALRRSIAFRTGERDGFPTIVIGSILSPPPYARVREEGTGYLPGGAITPKNAKRLAIPIQGGKALTSAGRLRFTARQLFANPESAGYTGAFTKNNIVYGKLRGKKYIEPLFVLKDRVVQQAANAGEGYLRSTIINQIKAGVHRDILGDAIRKRAAAGAS